MLDRCSLSGKFLHYLRTYLKLKECKESQSRFRQALAATDDIFREALQGASLESQSRVKQAFTAT